MVLHIYIRYVACDPELVFPEKFGCVHWTGFHKFSSMKKVCLRYLELYSDTPNKEHLEL